MPCLFARHFFMPVQNLNQGELKSKQEKPYFIKENLKNHLGEVFLHMKRLPLHL